MKPTGELSEALRQALPGLAIRRLREAGAGDFCCAYWVDDEWIVRVPKHQQASAALQREAAVLPGLAHALEVSIPVPEHVGTDRRTGFTVVAHRVIRGLALTRARLRSLAPAAQTAIADQLARFFHQLHSFPLSALSAAPVSRILETYRRRRREIEAAVLPRLPARCAHRCLELLEAIHPPDRRVLLHADLYEQHILIDRPRQTLAGIIDFGDMCLDDPDADLRTILDDLGPGFLAAVLRGEPERAARFDRARVYCIWDALSWNLEQITERRRDGVEESLRAIAHLAMYEAVTKTTR